MCILVSGGIVGWGYLGVEVFRCSLDKGSLKGGVKTLKSKGVTSGCNCCG